MNEIEKYEFGAHQVRVIDLDGEPWWVAKDICDVLGLGQVTRALAGLDEDEKQQVSLALTSIKGGNSRANIINESGLYSLILRSRKPEAKDFKKWVTREVLPTIRRTGSYGTPSVSVEMVINTALANMAHNEHVVPRAAQILAYARWKNPDKGRGAFIQLTLELELPAIDARGKRGITGENGA